MGERGKCADDKLVAALAHLNVVRTRTQEIVKGAETLVELCQERNHKKQQEQECKQQALFHDTKDAKNAGANLVLGRTDAADDASFLAHLHAARSRTEILLNNLKNTS